MTVSLNTGLIASAAQALKDRKEEVNRLNVFPVPDGDTGTNMSLTMDVVVNEVAKLGPDAKISAVTHAIIHGSLMGARGNSGVILSQILRGACEGIADSSDFSTETVAHALERAVTVAFQAVRKPVEGTMLTVLRDSSTAARQASNSGLLLEEALKQVSAAAFDSVRRTPELLPVLKENGVVDAGGLGLAVLIEGFVAALLGEAVKIVDVSSAAAPLLRVEPVDDWDDSEYLYCTEFLLYGEGIDRKELEEYISAQGGSELVVGGDGEYKVHVHTNFPGAVLQHMTSLGEVAEVHVNNMRRQTEARDRALKAEAEAGKPKKDAPPKPVGFVAVAAGDGLANILNSLGIDAVVSGGQTMNPSTQELLEAIESVNADKIVVMPNNKNIVMAANAAASVASKPAVVIPTTCVPQSFSAMLAYDGDESDFDQLVSEMSDAALHVRCGEVTTAVKDAVGKVGDIQAGQVIGISDHEIEVVGDNIADVTLRLAEILLVDGYETLTVLAGAELSDSALAELADALTNAHPDVDVETHRGEQPLYPVIMSAE